ncbi:mite group 2 allergen-like Ixo r 2 [Ornithodoros turicata]|uniref:mite group 2 allergen-like Ixo r 2 n=1 Tax=Ornithodoros turicata TaxID=34597 RepID=UPI003138E2F7
MRSFPLLLVLVGLAYGGHPKLKACGTESKAEIVYVNVGNCDSDPCEIERGNSTNFSIGVIPHVNSETVTLDARVSLIWGVTMKIPGLETNLCRFISCPVVAERKYEVSQSFTISQLVPSMSTTVTFKVIGDVGEIACYAIDIKIV